MLELPCSQEAASNRAPRCTPASYCTHNPGQLAGVPVPLLLHPTSSRLDHHVRVRSVQKEQDTQSSRQRPCACRDADDALGCVGGRMPRPHHHPFIASFHCAHSTVKRTSHIVQQLLGCFGVRCMCNSTPAPTGPIQPQHKHNCSRMPGPADWNKPQCHADPSNSVALFTVHAPWDRSTVDDTGVGFRDVHSHISRGDRLHACTHTAVPSSHCQHCMQLDRRTEAPAAAAAPAGAAAPACSYSSVLPQRCRPTRQQHLLPSSPLTTDQGETAVCRLLSHVRHSAAWPSHTHWVCPGLRGCCKRRQGARARSKFLTTQGSTCPPVPGMGFMHRTAT